jgi:hypothetical protein
MKFNAILLWVLFGLASCLASQAAPGAQRPLTGCIDQQNGQYVLLDDQMLKITGLQSAGPDREVFAKFVGRMVRVSGTGSTGQKNVFKVTSIEQVASSCGPAK